MSGAALLSRIEDAGLNASAPPQQRWMDGWLVRFSPSKAKRARCINAVAEGRLPLADKLGLAKQVYEEAGLPLIVRITPFSQPATLDTQLASMGLAAEDDTRVMACGGLSALRAVPLPAGSRWQAMGPDAFADAVGRLRGSPPAQRAAHAQRLLQSPVPFQALAIVREDDAALLACGQYAREADLVGLYDVFTPTEHRGRGLAACLCARLLVQAREQGAATAYLQVEAGNSAARRVYHRLGFSDGYGYHYRTAEPA